MYITRKVLNQILSGAEVILSIFLILVIAVIGLRLVFETFFSALPVSHTSAYYLEMVMNVAIGIEFAKMLLHHTPGTVIEVLLFAISRHIIVEQPSPLETLYGILAIAGLFAIKKYLFSSFREHESVICSGQITVGMLNLRYGMTIPADSSKKLCDVLREHLKRLDLPVEPGITFQLGDSTARIVEIHNGSIRRVALVRGKSIAETQ